MQVFRDESYSPAIPVDIRLWKLYYQSHSCKKCRKNWWLRPIRRWNLNLKNLGPSRLRMLFPCYVGYTPSKSTFLPYHFSTTLMAYSTDEADTKLDFTSTNHGAILRYQFPRYVIIWPCLDGIWRNNFIYSYVTGETNAAFIQTRRVSIVLHGGSDQSSVNFAASEYRCESQAYIIVFRWNHCG